MYIFRRQLPILWLNHMLMLVFLCIPSNFGDLLKFITYEKKQLMPNISD